MTQKIQRQHAFTISLIFNRVNVRSLTKPICIFSKKTVDKRERPRLCPRTAYDWLALVSRGISQSVLLHHLRVSELTATQWLVGLGGVESENE